MRFINRARRRIIKIRRANRIALIARARRDVSRRQRVFPPRREVAARIMGELFFTTTRGELNDP